MMLENKGEETDQISCSKREKHCLVFSILFMAFPSFVARAL